MLKNRMKCSINEEQVRNRLLYQPEIIELHLYEQDVFGDQRIRLEQTIQQLQTKGITVYLHHPIRFQGEYLDILSTDQEMSEYYITSSQILADICHTYSIQCVIHCHYSGTESSLNVSKERTLEMKEKIQSILSFGKDVFLWENTIEGIFSFHNPYLLSEIIQPLQLALVHDISHTFIGVKGDNLHLQRIAKEINPYVQYLHVVDSLGEIHDGLPLGEGRVVWEPLLSHILSRPFVYEILLEDFNDAKPMQDSREYLQSLVDKKGEEVYVFS